MHRRTVLALPLLPITIGSARADASHGGLASYYQRHAALIDGTVYGWDGTDRAGCERDAVAMGRRPRTTATRGHALIRSATARRCETKCCEGPPQVNHRNRWPFSSQTGPTIARSDRA